MTGEPLRTASDGGSHGASDRAPTSVDQLLLDLSWKWLDRYGRASTMPRGSVCDPHDLRDDLWRATAAGVVDAFSAIYLLAVLREVAPDAAARAARYLQVDAAPSDLPRLVRDWAAAVTEGRPLGPVLP